MLRCQEQVLFLPAQRGLGTLYSQAVGRPRQSGLLKTLMEKVVCTVYVSGWKVGRPRQSVSSE